MLVNTGMASAISEFVVPCIPEVITDLLISLNSLGTGFVESSESCSYINYRYLKKPNILLLLCGPEFEALKKH